MPARPPVQPVNDVEVVCVHVTVPDEPNEMVFVSKLKLAVLATLIVALGRVTLLLRDVVEEGGEAGQYDGSVTVTDDAEL